MKSYIAFFSALLALWITLSAPSHAETIVMAVPGPGNMAFLPVYLIKAIGADHDEGLKLKLRYFNGGPLAMRDMMTNNSDFVAIGLPAIAAARADGMPVVAFGQLSESAMFVLLLRTSLKNQVTSITQLNGRRIGIPVGTSTQRTAGQMIAEHLLIQAGLKPGDNSFISTGLNRESQRAALSSGTVDVLMGDEPFASELVAEGAAVILADMYPPNQSKHLLGGSILRAALATRENVYMQHPETVKKVQRMFDRTLEWLSKHSSQEVADKLVGQPGFDVAKTKQLIDILNRSQGMFPNRLAWNAQAVATTESFFHRMAANPAESNLPFAAFIRN